jgi:hypothetical protein
MGGRAVEGTGLENRRTRKGLVGSNPTPSAIWVEQMSTDQGQVGVAEEADAEEARRRYAAFLKERDDKLAISNEQQKFVDKTVLTFGAGALGLTLTFVHDLTHTPCVHLDGLVRRRAARHCSPVCAIERIRESVGD